MDCHLERGGGGGGQVRGRGGEASQAHILLSTILHRVWALSVSCAQPRLRQISNIALMRRPADWKGGGGGGMTGWPSLADVHHNNYCPTWVMYTMSDMSAKPSSLSCET